MPELFSLAVAIEVGLKKMIIEGEMDAMSAENALFSEITPQMQVNRNSHHCIYKTG